MNGLTYEQAREYIKTSRNIDVESSEYLALVKIRHKCLTLPEMGTIRKYSTWQDVKRPDSRDIVFMDNNVLACEWGLEQIADMGGKNVRVDFNQGLDARLITDDVAQMLARLKWINFVRMSADTDAMLDVVLTAH